MLANMRGRMLLAAGLLVCLAPLAESCCGVSAEGRPVAFGSQSNIIVWNPATGTEHFIRKASFASKASDFAFIAPTPTVPELVIVSSDAFGLLSSLKPAPIELRGCAAQMDAAKSLAVVVQEQDLGDYHVVTLKASDTQSLAKYLKDNQYASSPDISEWADYYVKKNWLLTAFKLRKGVDANSTNIEFSTVRMSFKTNAPFNPYRVPKSNMGSGTLSVYFVSDGEYAASVDGRDWNHVSWDADVDPKSALLADYLKLPVSDIPANAHVTKFEEADWTSQQRTGDILFHRTLSSRIAQAITTTIVVMFIALWAWTRRRRRALSEAAVTKP
ncbi:MAG: DUF2330 domain-containing protein [Armatimonadota bacterium]